MCPPGTGACTPPNGCGPGSVVVGGCNTSGNFPCLVCGLSSWDGLSINWIWGQEDELYGVLVWAPPPGQAASNWPSWIGTFLKTLVKGPSTGQGSCLGVFIDTVAAPLKQLQSAAKNYVPLIVGAMQSGPVASAWYMSQLNNMLASGAVEADPQVAAVVTTAGAAAATAAPYVSAAAPYLAPVGGDAVLLNGVIKEVQSGMSGQCTW
jgi:hypothetical protein